MPRFVVHDDFDESDLSISVTKDEHSMNERNLNDISLSTSDTLNVSSDNEWLKAAAEKKGLKLSPPNTKMIFRSTQTTLADQLYNTKSPRSNSIINTDFECLKTSAIEKGLEILRKKSSKTMKSPTPALHNSTLCDNDILNQLKKMTPDNGETRKVDAKNILNSSDENSARTQIVFSKKKLLLENELLRKEDVMKEIEQRKEEMENFSKNLIYQKAIMRTILAQKRQEEEQVKSRRLKAEEDIMNEKIKQNEIRRKREQQLQKQRIQEAIEKLESEQAEYARQEEMRDKLLEKIKACPASFESKYENINSLFMTCKDRHTAILALSPHYQRLKDLGWQMEIIKEKTQSGNVTNEDVETAESILRSLDEVIQMYKLETDRIDRDFNAELSRREDEYRQAELKLQAAPQQNVQLQLQPTADRVDNSREVPAEAALPPAEQQAAPENPVQSTQETAPQDDLHAFVHPDLWQLYVQCQTFLQQFQRSHNDILYNESLKKFRFECQKAVITPVNAINAISREHLTDKYNRVVNFLTGKSTPKVDIHPQGFSFCIYMLAKKIVSQGETLVSSKPEMAFSLASFAVAIWNEFPDFGEMLLVHFRTACPYTVPIWLPQLEDTSGADTKDYRNLKKHSGILRLYASVIVSRPRQGVTKSHPHGIGNAWKWLAATMNIEPRIDTAELISTLVLDMLEVTGSSLQCSYPRQFAKLLHALRTNFFPKLKSLVNEAGGPVTRLEEFLEKCASTNVVPPPAGLLPPNYW